MYWGEIYINSIIMDEGSQLMILVARKNQNALSPVILSPIMDSF